MRDFDFYFFSQSELVGLLDQKKQGYKFSEATQYYWFQLFGEILNGIGHHMDQIDEIFLCFYFVSIHSLQGFSTSSNHRTGTCQGQSLSLRRQLLLQWCMQRDLTFRLTRNSYKGHDRMNTWESKLSRIVLFVCGSCGRCDSLPFGSQCLLALRENKA